MNVGEDSVEYFFEGTTGDIIVIEVFIDAMDVINGLSPELQILNGRGTTLIDTEDESGLENYDNFRSQVVFDIPADGIYTVLVANNLFFTVSRNANFTLRLVKPDILLPNEVVTSSASNLLPSFFVVIAPDTFTITYNNEGSQYFPAVDISRVDNGSTELMASMFGESLIAGSITVTPNRNTLHLIEVKRGIFDLDVFSENSTEFTIELTSDS